MVTVEHPTSSKLMTATAKLIVRSVTSLISWYEHIVNSLYPNKAVSLILWSETEPICMQEII